MRTIAKLGMIGGVVVAAMSASSPAAAFDGSFDQDRARQCRGCDDPAGHIRRGRGADDGPDHIRRSRGSDDSFEDRGRRGHDDAVRDRGRRGHDNAMGDDRGRRGHDAEDRDRGRRGHDDAMEMEDRSSGQGRGYSLQNPI